LFVLVNAAFASAARFAPAYRRVRDAFRAAAGRDAPLIALHWRIDEDFTSANRTLAHGLDAQKAIAATCAALRPLAASGPFHVLLLGDFGDGRAVVARVVKALSPCGVKVRLHSKETLLKDGLDASFSDGPAGGDDVKGQLDFRLGVGADVFVGAPFSSFSVLIAQARAARRRPSTMLAADTRDRLGQLMRAHAPYARDEFAKNAHAGRGRRVVAAVPVYEEAVLGLRNADADFLGC